MPKLSSQCLNDIKRYIHLRYDHKGEEWIQSRIKRVIRALKKESKDVQDDYSVNVSTFFEINRKVLEDAERAKTELIDPVITKMLDMDKDEIVKLVVKHGGNVNAVVEGLRGNNDKQH